VSLRSTKNQPSFGAVTDWRCIVSLVCLTRGIGSGTFIVPVVGIDYLPLEI
jgi:hypothetical protein